MNGFLCPRFGHRKDHSPARPFVLLILVGLLAQSPASARAASTLEDRLDSLLDAHRGRVAIVVEHLETGERYDRNADEPMPTASLIKFPIMIEAYRQSVEGQVDLDRMVTLRDEDKVPGSGILTTHFSDGATFSLRDAIRLMIAYSDNTATNLVLDQIGLRSTAETMAAMGFPETKVHSKVYRRDTSVFPERSKKFGLGSTTASDMVALLDRLHDRKLVDREASEAMLGHLLACESTSMLKRFLPEGTKVYHKTGSVSEVRTSAGIIETPGGPVAVCVLTADNEDRRWTDDNAAERLIAEVAREVYNHFASQRSPDDAKQPGPSTLKIGAEGPEVETLQRLLNARLEPSPELSIDGDFGPATESALIRFQESRKLQATGVADSTTWEALGTLPEEEPRVPSPEEVNGKPQAKQPPDSLDGPPLVTAKGWAIVDAKSGERLWGQNDQAPLDMASTTKITTALVVLRLADDDPDVLDEVVTFSKRADGTTGSTSDVHAGERLPVRELLYGLLLPSGNDAAVALGEHFGHRFPPVKDDADSLDPLPRFIAEMNRVAEELDLDATHYANPHGLTAAGHHASAGTSQCSPDTRWPTRHSPGSSRPRSGDAPSSMPRASDGTSSGRTRTDCSASRVSRGSKRERPAPRGHASCRSGDVMDAT